MAEPGFVSAQLLEGVQAEDAKQHQHTHISAQARQRAADYVGKTAES